MKVAMPEVHREFTHIFYGNNDLNIRFYTMQKIKFTVYFSWEEYYILIPYKYIHTMYINNSIIIIVAKVFFIYGFFNFSKTIEFIVCNLRRSEEHTSELQSR